MRNKYLLFILFFILISVANLATAQDLSLDKIRTVKVEQLSDEQIISLWQKASARGLSEQEIYALLKQNQMPEAELQALKDRVTLLGLNNKPKAAKPVAAAPKKIDQTRFKDDSVGIPQPLPQRKITKETPKLEIYGAEFFNQTDVKFEPNFSVATPKSYVLGPGDEVIVLVTGMNETTVRTTVNPDGNLQIPYAGIVYVNGFTIEQTTSMVRNKMVKVYPALRTGQTQLTLNLGNTRRIKISIIGEVKKPGGFTLSSLASIGNALYFSGGPNSNGSLRNVQLIRNNRVYKTVDFYPYLQKGLLEGNVRLEDQDIIRIPVYTKRVSISGQVKRPAIFELKDNETLSDLITYAGGFTDIAYKGIAKIDQINELQREVKDVPANLFGNYVPRNGDAVVIGSVTNRYTNKIILDGAVYQPGVYELSAGLSLSQLLKNAQGLKPEAYLERGVISRTLPNLEKTSLTFVPSEIVSGRNDIPLMRDDSVTIFAREAFIPNQKVTVQGYVRRPSIIPFRKGLKLADVIATAGGFNDEAADHHVEISRIIKNESDSVATQLVNTFVIDMTKTNAADVELEPMDIINVPRLVNYRGLGNVSVKGEVIFPGEYAVQKRDETASEFLSRAGGLTPYGSLENIQVYRQGVRVNVDLTKQVNNHINKNAILLPGDSIYVPRVISYVEVSGAVNNPQYISYKGRNFKYYINAAGGTTENARLKGAYIQYPDGLNQPVKHVLFFKSYPTVKPGSKIVVPEKSPESRFKLGFADISGIATALTALISVVVVLARK